SRCPGLPVDALLRLQGVHRLWHRAPGGLAHPARGRQPGHGPGPEPGARGARHPHPVAAGREPGGSAAMRVRLRYTKAGKVRWTSHRDLARMFERAFRRTQLPIAYSGGFAPRPKVSFGLALPTGAESEAEYLDLEPVEGTTGDLNDGDLTTLATQPRAVRPGELVRAIDPGLEEAWVRRTNQWIGRDGARVVPLDATDAQHVRLAGARAR